MKLGPVILVPQPRKSWSWTLDLFWVFVPLTIACGFWELGGWETLAFYSAVGVNVLLGGVTIARLLGYMIATNVIATNVWKERLYSIIQGVVWAAAMAFVWPDTGLGHVYLVLILLNFCLLEFWHPKKG